MSRPIQAPQGVAWDPESDPMRLAGWDQQGGYSPYVPTPGMVAHGQFQSTNDPNSMHNFGAFHTPNHLAHQQQHQYNNSQQVPLHTSRHTQEQSRFQEPPMSVPQHFQGFTPPMNLQAMPFTPHSQAHFAYPATHQQAQSEEHHYNSFPSHIGEGAWPYHYPLLFSHGYRY